MKKKKKAPINIMVDEDVKEKATEILDELGINMSTAISIYLRQIINKNGIPFEIKNNPKKIKK